MNNLIVDKEKQKVFKILDKYCKHFVKINLPYHLFCKIWEIKIQFDIFNKLFNDIYHDYNYFTINYVQKGSIKYKKNGKPVNKIKKAIRLISY